MRIGRLSERITLQYDAGTTRDDYGNEDADWQALAQVWAGLEHLRGAEIFAAEQVAAEKVVRFRIRYRDDVTERLQ